MMRGWLRFRRRPSDASDSHAGRGGLVTADHPEWVAAQPSVRDLVVPLLSDLGRPSRTKLAILVIGFALSVVAEHQGFVTIGMPGENPIAVIILALLVRAVKLRVTINYPLD